MWNRFIDDLEEPGPDTDRLDEGHPQDSDLSRLRPDAWAVSRSNWQVLPLELTHTTRAHVWRQDRYEATETFETQRYSRLRERTRMLRLLSRGWNLNAESIPLAVWIRGPLHGPGWLAIPDWFGVSAAAQATPSQPQFLQESTRQALAELDLLYRVCSEALCSLHARHHVGGSESA